MHNWGIHWFRRDLRVTGNPSLNENLKRNSGRVLGIFCFDSTFLKRPDFSHNRFAFFLKTMGELRREMRDLGGELLVVDCLPLETFQRLLGHLSSNRVSHPSLITWNRDYEPFARRRDETVEKYLRQSGIATHNMRDHLLFEPWEVMRDNGFYQVYSPYGKQWFNALSSAEGKSRLQLSERDSRRVPFKMKWTEISSHQDFPFSDKFNEFEMRIRKHITVPIPEAGFKTAFRVLEDFRTNLRDYKKHRDIPSYEGTSRLSIYLKNGSLTVPQIIQTLGLEKCRWMNDNGPTQFTKELAWREFYYSILYHRPQVEHESFNPKYVTLKWENNKNYFARWCEGTTGYPIVDAGMRQLLTTGWMHNRVRMIVASFLTKDLLIDWRWGENHFMKYLLDGDLAPNNGGWQWAASTGCDPQPYFRVFNPWLQSAKFDPDGHYIRKYVPELRDAPVAALHKADQDRTKWKYPAPIVDHSERRELALQLYSKK